MNLQKKTTATLLPEETLMIQLIKTSSDNKIQIEFGEILKKEINVLQLLNRGDERFNQSGVRRAWMTAEKSQIKELFGIDCDTAEFVKTDKDKFVYEVNRFNPTFQNIRFRVVVKEYTESEIKNMIEKTSSEKKKESLQYLLDNIETKARRAGKDGEFLTHQGERVFSLTDVELPKTGEVTHRWLEPDALPSDNVVQQVIADAEQVIIPNVDV